MSDPSLRKTPTTDRAWLGIRAIRATSRVVVQPLVLPLVAGGCPSILVASIGRVGSTLLWSAIADGRMTELFGRSGRLRRQLVKANAWDLRNKALLPGAVYKTHDLPYSLTPQDKVKVVFLYGCPSEIILSIIRCHNQFGSAWVRAHLSHMHACGTYEEMFDRDVMRLEEQMTAWSQTRGVPVFGIRYETMWKNTAALSDFLGFEVVLPAQNARASAGMSPQVVSRIRDQFGYLDRMADSFPEYFSTVPAVRQRQTQHNDGAQSSIRHATAQARSH